MALINKLKAIGDGFRTSRGTTQEYTLDEMAVLAAEVPVVEPLSVTKNGTYTPPEGVDGYSQVTVNVVGGGQPEIVEGVACMEVRKVTSQTSLNEIDYPAEQFVAIDVYPNPYGVVEVTYGNLTKTIQDTEGTGQAQLVFFGELYGEVDDIETPQSGILTISGDYHAFGLGVYGQSKSSTTTCDCITRIYSFGKTETIPVGAFSYCDTLHKRLVIPEGIKHIEESAFDGNYFKEVILPSSIERIGDHAFSHSNSDFEYTVRLLREEPPVIDMYTFSFGGAPDCITFIVPIGCSDAYRNGNGWSNYVNCTIREE